MASRPALTRANSSKLTMDRQSRTLRGQIDPNQILVKKRKIKGDTKYSQALLEAALKGDTKYLNKVKEKRKNYDVNAHDMNDGATALHIALYAGKDEFVQTLIKDITGVQVNAVSKQGESPLHIAVMRGSEPLIALLLSHHANAIAEDSNHMTPIHLAIYSQNKNILNSLLQTLPQTKSIDSYIRKGNTLLLEASASGNAYAIKELVNRRADVNFKNDGGNTALHLATLEGKASTVRALMQYSPDLCISNMSGLTPIELARQTNKLDLVPILNHDHSGHEDHSKLSFKGHSEGAFGTMDEFVPRAPTFSGRIVTDLPPPDWSTNPKNTKTKMTFKSKNQISDVPPIPLPVIEGPPEPVLNFPVSENSFAPPPVTGNTGFFVPPPPPSELSAPSSKTAPSIAPNDIPAFDISSIPLPDFSPPPSDSLPPPSSDPLPPPLDLSLPEPDEQENNSFSFDMSSLPPPPMN